MESGRGYDYQAEIDGSLAIEQATRDRRILRWNIDSLVGTRFWGGVIGLGVECCV